MANDKNEKKVKKEKKHFSKEFKTELKKVTWPTGKQLVNNTIAVITIVIITALIVFVLDLGFEMLNKYGINGIKSAINKNENNTTIVDDSNVSTSEETDIQNVNEGQEDDTDDATPIPDAE